MRAKAIQSEANPSYKLYRELLQPRGIRKHGLALLSGDKIVPEVALRYPHLVEAWLSESGGPSPTIQVPWLEFSPALFKALDSAGTGGPLLVMRFPEFAEWHDNAPWPLGCSLFVPFQNPENVGAVIRSAAAFGVKRVVLLAEAAHPFHPKSMRAAGTALFQVEFCRGPSIDELEVVGAPLITLGADGMKLTEARFPKVFGILPGVEGPGLPEHLRTKTCVSIPMEPGVESLNAATATAIALYVWHATPQVC